MKSFIERIGQEFIELFYRTAKLEEFMESDMYDELDADSQHDLTLQHTTMMMYLKILHHRLCHLYELGEEVPEWALLDFGDIDEDSLMEDEDDEEFEDDEDDEYDDLEDDDDDEDDEDDEDLVAMNSSLARFVDLFQEFYGVGVKSVTMVLDE